MYQICGHRIKVILSLTTNYLCDIFKTCLLCHKHINSYIHKSCLRYLSWTRGISSHLQIIYIYIYILNFRLNFILSCTLRYWNLYLPSVTSPRFFLCFCPPPHTPLSPIHFMPFDLITLKTSGDKTNQEAPRYAVLLQPSIISSQIWPMFFECPHFFSFLAVGTKFHTHMLQQEIW